MRFAEMTAPEIRGIDRDRAVLVAPIAACEQHSGHLPVITDAVLVGAVADGLEAARPDRVLLLPVQWLGASEHHLPFGGTLTATLPTYEQMLIEILTPPLRDGFRRVLLLNGHGGNIDPLHVALRRLDAAFPDAVLTGAAYWELAAGEIAALCEGPRKSMGHACEIETSMMMHLRPDLVREDRIRDDPSPGVAPEGLFHAVDFGRRTERGAVGYPSYASAEKGGKMLEAIVPKVVEAADRVLEMPVG
ncbi:creatininase family protein [Tautonia plasticadhaerens]|uniref:Creatinine amidohydrolase n=1 Tax=Tautonia plasticadhaerens TaxID=2527974 RepID=A0A518HBZ9_9BACT|nr:creatininase family protein [Tautonia plasticadhaerens]QDV38371.1 Creatinine amidohydrolase [Tautonia plasticadhaerens]